MNTRITAVAILAGSLAIAAPASAGTFGDFVSSIGRSVASTWSSVTSGWRTTDRSLNVNGTKYEVGDPHQMVDIYEAQRDALLNREIVHWDLPDGQFGPIDNRPATAKEIRTINKKISGARALAREWDMSVTGCGCSNSGATGSQFRSDQNGH